MLNFGWTETGKYDPKKLSDPAESVVFDKANNKVRLFDEYDFYFSALSDEYLDAADGSTGLSQRGAKAMFDRLDGSIRGIEASIGDFDFSKSYAWTADSSADSDLDIADENGRVILRLYGGQIKTRFFDSSSVLADVSAIKRFDFDKNYAYVEDTSNPDYDLDVADSSGHAVLRLYGGQIRTRYFDSSLVLADVGELDASVNALETRQAASDASVISAFRRNDLQDASLASYVSRLSKAESSTGKLESRAGTTEVSVGGLTTRIGRTESSVWALEFAASNVSAWRSEHVRDVSALSSSISKTRDDVLGIVAENERTAAEGMTALDSSFAYVDGRVDDVSSRLAALLERVSALEGAKQS